jgi:hypothetical protein
MKLGEPGPGFLDGLEVKYIKTMCLVDSTSAVPAVVIIFVKKVHTARSIESLWTVSPYILLKSGHGQSK